MTKDRVFELIKNNFPLKKNDKKIDLFKEGIIDSFGVINLINIIEKDFKIKINFNKFSPENFRTINKIEKFLKKNYSL
mgnify:CR=1 FL=1|jgi:acyl carrier protein